MGWSHRIIVWSWLLLLCFGGLVLTGCHTVHGAGEDVAGAGRAIERAAE